MTNGETSPGVEFLPLANVLNDGMGDLGAVYEPLHSVPSVQEIVNDAWTKSGKTPSNGRQFSEDATGSYLSKLNLEPLLTAEHEVALAKIIENGRDASEVLAEYGFDSESAGQQFRYLLDEAYKAKHQFILSNLRLVVSVAKRFPLPHGMDMLDLVQEGNLGLEHAVDLFDWRKGFKFSTYATFWIKQAIGRGLDQKSNAIRLPSARAAKLRAGLRAVRGETEDLSSELRRQYDLVTPTSLNRKLKEDSDIELIDVIPSDALETEAVVISLYEHELIARLLERLERLDPETAHATRARFGINNDGVAQSYKEIGEVMHKTPSTIQRMVNRAIRALSDMAEVQ